MPVNILLRYRGQDAELSLHFLFGQYENPDTTRDCKYQAAGRQAAWGGSVAALSSTKLLEEKGHENIQL